MDGNHKPEGPRQVDVRATQPVDAAPAGHGGGGAAPVVPQTATRWEPGWSGAPGRRIYTATHLPAGRAQASAVLLVAPLFHELPRSRRLLTEMAAHLSSLGFPAMQFDFYGMGDSMGLGEDTDFDSMRRDLGVAEAALRARIHAGSSDRLIVIAFRGGALPVMSWIGAGARPDLVVLWEPILDGLNWLQELEREDAAERRSPGRYSSIRKGRDRECDHDGDDGDDLQLMGVTASRQLREDLADFSMPSPEARARIAFWAVTRPHMRALEVEPAFGLELDADTPGFGGSTRMESALFMSPGVRATVDALGRAMLEWSSTAAGNRPGG